MAHQTAPPTVRRPSTLRRGLPPRRLPPRTTPRHRRPLLLPKRPSTSPLLLRPRLLLLLRPRPSRRHPLRSPPLPPYRRSPCTTSRRLLLRPPPHPSRRHLLLLLRPSRRRPLRSPLLRPSKRRPLRSPLRLRCRRSPQEARLSTSPLLPLLRRRRSSRGKEGSPTPTVAKAVPLVTMVRGRTPTGISIRKSWTGGYDSRSTVFASPI